MYFIVLLTCVVDIISSTEVEQAFVAHQLVNQVFSVAPEKLLNVIYNDDIKANLGNEIKVSDVQVEPKLSWPHKPDKYYTLLMADADAPTRESPVARSKLLWLVVNIKGNDIKSAQTGSARIWPEFLSDNHRIYFLVFEHDIFEFNEEYDGSEERENFSPDTFLKRYQLGWPYAGNFFVTKII